MEIKTYQRFVDLLKDLHSGEVIASTIGNVTPRTEERVTLFNKINKAVSDVAIR